MSYYRFPEKHKRWTTKLNINKFMLGLHNPFVKICMYVFVWYKYIAYIIIIFIRDKTKLKKYTPGNKSMTLNLLS